MEKETALAAESEGVADLMATWVAAQSEKAVDWVATGVAVVAAAQVVAKLAVWRAASEVRMAMAMEVAEKGSTRDNPNTA